MNGQLKRVPDYGLKDHSVNNTAALVIQRTSIGWARMFTLQPVFPRTFHFLLGLMQATIQASFNLSDTFYRPKRIRPKPCNGSD